MKTLVCGRGVPKNKRTFPCLLKLRQSARFNELFLLFPAKRPGLLGPAEGHDDPARLHLLLGPRRGPRPAAHGLGQALILKSRVKKKPIL